MHSLLQVANVETGLVIDGCTVNSKNGINLNNTENAVITNSDISVSGYAVRIGVNGSTGGELTLTNNTLKTDGTEDAVVVLRGTVPALTMTENVVSGATHISGTTAATRVDAENNYWDGGKPVVDGTPIEVESWYTDPGKSEKPKSYVSLGASNVNGYGLRGYIPAGSYPSVDALYEAAALDYEVKETANVLGYLSETPKSYPVTIADTLGYNLEQLAISSMRAEELRILLDNSYYGDSYSAWRFVGSEPDKWFNLATRYTGGRGGLDELREQYQAKVAAADLVTVDIGMNNFGVYISYQLTDNYSKDKDLTLIDPALAEEFDAGKDYVKELIAQYMPEQSGVLLGMEDFVDTLAYALVGFCVNFDAVMEKIYELNPDATVVAVSIQNIMDGLNVTLPGVEGELPLGDLFGALINAANIYIAGGSPYADKYLVADVRQDGRVEFYLDKIVAYDGTPVTLDQNIKDCFDIYDGTPGANYDSGLHVKYELNKKTSGCYDDDMLNAAYDVVASILQAAAKVETVDLAVLGDMRDVESALANAIDTELSGAITSGNDTYDLSADFFEKVAAAASVSVDTVKSVASLAVRTSIGNSFFGHPTPDGHQEIANAILSTLSNGTTGGDILEDEALIAIREAVEFVAEYYDDAYAYAYQYAAEAGYIGMAVDAIDGVIADLNAIDLSATDMTDAFKAEVKAEIDEIIKTLEAAKTLLAVADVLDQASLDALLALLNEAGEDILYLENLLVQAGVDVNELVIIPALNAAYDKLINEVIPAIDAALQQAVKAGTQWLLAKLGEGYNALVEAIIEALPGVDAWLYDWLYNNPDKVIAFFAEYGDDALNILAANKDAIVKVLGYIAMTYGEDIAEYVVDNADEILKDMVEWYETYGDRVWAMIKVYLDELGLLPSDEEIENAKDAISDALDQLVNSAMELTREQINALIGMLEDALDDLKEAVINSPEVQALIKEVEDAIEALKKLVNDVEDATAEALKSALEDVKDAMDALVDAALNSADAAVRAAVAKLQAILYDATHGEYTVSDKSYYVSLGDSTVTGYGADNGKNPEGYDNLGYQKLVPNSFPYMLAEKLGLDVNSQYMQLGMAGLRTNDLLYILDETQTPDDYFTKRVLEQYISAGGGLDTVCTTFKEELAKADLVTLSIGNCNFTGVQETGIISEWMKNEPTMKALLNNPTIGGEVKNAINALGVNLDAPVYTAAWDNYLNADEQAELETAFEKIQEALIQNGIPESTTIYLKDLLPADLAGLINPELKIDVPVAELLTEFIEWYAYCYVTHAFSYDDVLNKIHEMTRPDAQVVVIGMYNPMDELTITYEGQEIPVGEYIDYVLGAVNLSTFVYAMMDENTTYVPVHDVESVADRDMAQNGNTFELMDFLVKYSKEVYGNFTDHHETVAGHAYIAECIYNALVLNEEETGLLGDADGDGDVDVYDAVIILDYLVGNVDAEEIVLSNSNVDGDEEVTVFDAAMILDYIVGNVNGFVVVS